MHKLILLKKLLKYTLKQLRHVSVQSRLLRGAHYPCLLKLLFVKIANYDTSVCDEFGGDVAAYIGRPVLNNTASSIVLIGFSKSNKSYRG
jgi:hypothetical protein